MSSFLDRLRAALADRYLVERELGSGGMATVYLGRDMRHERSVAIKVLRPELASAVALDRFLREIKIAARLHHPHILPLHDSGEAAGFVYYVMPYVEGDTLRDRLERDGRLPLEEALQIIREVGDALAFAHEREILHRDTKPENVLFVGGHAILADFGVAVVMTTALDERLTKPGEVLGTPAYMSPEQAMGRRKLTPRSDVYSLACILFELLVGEPPFHSSNPKAALVRRADQAVPAIRERRSEVPAAVDAAVATAMAWLGERRFRSVREFLAALP